MKRAICRITLVASIGFTPTSKGFDATSLPCVNDFCRSMGIGWSNGYHRCARPDAPRGFEYWKDPVPPSLFCRPSFPLSAPAMTPYPYFEPSRVDQPHSVAWPTDQLPSLPVVPSIQHENHWGSSVLEPPASNPQALQPTTPKIELNQPAVGAPHWEPTPKSSTTEEQPEDSIASPSDDVISGDSPPSKPPASLAEPRVVEPIPRTDPWKAVDELPGPNDSVPTESAVETSVPPVTITPDPTPPPDPTDVWPRRFQMDRVVPPEVIPTQPLVPPERRPENYSPQELRDRFRINPQAPPEPVFKRRKQGFGTITPTPTPSPDRASMRIVEPTVR